MMMSSVEPTSDADDTTNPSYTGDSEVSTEPSNRGYSYSQEANVAAIRNYYQFLTSMYLDDSKVIEPPAGGWPSIPVDGWPNFHKTDEVVALLRQLPYIQLGSLDIHVAPGVVSADWQGQAPNEGLDEKTNRAFWSEPHPDEAVIPAHIVGLALIQDHSPPILLDTELGVICWYECHVDVRASFELPEAGDAYGWVDEGLIDEDQAMWRAEGGIWTITDFFENLKASFRKLEFVPLGSREVADMQDEAFSERVETRDRVKNIYVRHGWPDMTKFDKQKCSAEIFSYLEEFESELAET